MRRLFFTVAIERNVIDGFTWNDATEIGGKFLCRLCQSSASSNYLQSPLCSIPLFNKRTTTISSLYLDLFLFLFLLSSSLSLSESSLFGIVSHYFTHTHTHTHTYTHTHNFLMICLVLCMNHNWDYSMEEVASLTRF